MYGVVSGTSAAAVSKPQSRRKMIGNTLVAEHVKQKRSRHQGNQGNQGSQGKVWLTV